MLSKQDFYISKDIREPCQDNKLWPTISLYEGKSSRPTVFTHGRGHHVILGIKPLDVNKNPYDGYIGEIFQTHVKVDGKPLYINYTTHNSPLECTFIGLGENCDAVWVRDAKTDKEGYLPVSFRYYSAAEMQAIEDAKKTPTQKYTEYLRSVEARGGKVIDTKVPVAPDNNPPALLSIVPPFNATQEPQKVPIAKHGAPSAAVALLKAVEAEYGNTITSAAAEDIVSGKSCEGLTGKMSKIAIDGACT